MKPVRQISGRKGTWGRYSDPARSAEVITEDQLRFDEIARMFSQAVPVSLDRIDRAVAAGDAEAAEQAARALKVSICKLCAEVEYRASAALNQMAKGERLEQVRDALEKLRTQLQVLERDIKGNTRAEKISKD